MMNSVLQWLCIFCCAAVVCSAAPAHAQSGPKVSRGGRVVENWYSYWGLGYSLLQYPDDVQSTLDQLEELPGVSRLSFGIDALGFYWTFQNTSTVLGAVVNMTGDSYSTDVDNSYTIYQGLISASLMHSLTDITGEGLTIRGDLGLATVNSELKSSLGSATTTTTSDTEIGIGFLVGVGYALPVSSETSLLFNGNYAMRIVEGDNLGAITFGLGVLF